MNEFLKNANYVGNSPNKKDIKVTDSYEIDSPELLATAKGLYEIWQQVIAAKNSSDDSLDKIKKMFAFLQASGVDIGSLTPSFDGIVYEAPKDGNSYVRNNEAWLKLAEMVADVLDTNLYLRTKNAWSLYVPPTANSLNVYTKPEMDTHLQDIDASVLNAEKIAKEAAQQSLQIAQNVISIEQNVEKINHDLNEKIDSIPNIDEVIELTDNVSKIQTDVGKINTEIVSLQNADITINSELNKKLSNQVTIINNTITTFDNLPEGYYYIPANNGPNNSIPFNRATSRFLIVKNFSSNTIYQEMISIDDYKSAFRTRNSSSTWLNWVYQSSYTTTNRYGTVPIDFHNFITPGFYEISPNIHVNAPYTFTTDGRCPGGFLRVSIDGVSSGSTLRIFHEYMIWQNVPNIYGCVFTESYHVDTNIWSKWNSTALDKQISQSSFPVGDVLSLSLTNQIEAGKTYLVLASTGTNLPVIDNTYYFLNVQKRFVNNELNQCILELKSLIGNRVWNRLWDTNGWLNPWFEIGGNVDLSRSAIDLNKIVSLGAPYSNNPYTMPYDGYVIIGLLAQIGNNTGEAYMDGHIFARIYWNGSSNTVMGSFSSPFLKAGTRVWATNNSCVSFSVAPAYYVNN